MKFNITLNDQDLIDFIVCVYSNMSETEQNYKGTRFLILILLSLSLFFIYLFLAYNNGFGLIVNSLIGLMVGISISVIFLLILTKTSYQNFIVSKVKSNKKQFKKLLHHNQFVAEFTDEEMKETYNSGFNSRKYSEIEGILNDKEHIYIMTGAIDGMLLPLRCLDGKEQELVDFLMKKLEGLDDEV